MATILAHMPYFTLIAKTNQPSQSAENHVTPKGITKAETLLFGVNSQVSASRAFYRSTIVVYIAATRISTKYRSK